MNRTIAIMLLATAGATPLFAEGADMELGGEITVWPRDPGKFLFVRESTVPQLKSQSKGFAPTLP